MYHQTYSVPPTNEFEITINLFVWNDPLGESYADIGFIGPNNKGFMVFFNHIGPPPRYKGGCNVGVDTDCDCNDGGPECFSQGITANVNHFVNYYGWQWVNKSLPSSGYVVNDPSKYNGTLRRRNIFRSRRKNKYI